MASRIKTGTARFASVVQKAGRPEQATLWQEPNQDPDFRKAIRENRVLTVKQENVGTKKDFAVVGYEKEKNASYLLFPKSLAPFAGKRIVGVRYDLIAPSRLKGKPVDAESKARPISKPKEKEQRFAVVVEWTAKARVTESVTAENKKAAKKLALERVKERRLEFNGAPTSCRVLKIVKE